MLNRYHLRAYSYTSTGWRDFVLTRILKASKSDSKIPWIEPSKDSDWTKKVELTFAPNPELPSDIVETLEMDYPIENGELKVITNLLTKFMLKEDSVSETLNQINVTGYIWIIKGDYLKIEIFIISLIRYNKIQLF